MRIWGKEVHFRAKKINEVYGLLNADMREFEAKDCTPGSSLVKHPCQGKEVLWNDKKSGIILN